MGNAKCLTVTGRGRTATCLYVFFLREDREGRLDVLVEEELERGLPELVDALGVQPRVDADDDVRLLHPLPVDVPVGRLCSWTRNFLRSSEAGAGGSGDE